MLLNIRGFHVDSAATNVKNLLLHVSLTIILPERKVKIGATGNTIRKALSFTPDFKAATIASGNDDIGIIRENLCRLSYGECLDDTPISVIRNPCEVRFNAERDVADTLSFQFQDGKFRFGEPDWISRLLTLRPAHVYYLWPFSAPYVGSARAGRVPEPNSRAWSCWHP